MPDSSPAPARRPCPICGKPLLAQHTPFCSVRCRQVDLGRWLGERYAVETPEAPEFEDRLQSDE